jgi:hypothetical protein
LTVASILVAGAASADAPVRFHEEFTDIIDDYCDVPGLRVRSDVAFDGTLRIRQRAGFMEQVRGTFVDTIDNNGTPNDPSDDEFLAMLDIVKESTGRSDDFCAAVVPVLTD